MAESAALFACPSCRKRFGWKPDLAGKKVRCSGCNLKLRVPAAPGGKAEALEPMTPGGAAPAAAKPPKPAAPKAPPPKKDDDYDISLDDDLLGLGPTGAAEPPQLAEVGGDGGAGGEKCPSCGQKVKPNAVICINCGFNLKAGKRMKTAVEVGGDEDARAGGAAVAAGAPGLDSERWKRLAAQVKSKEEADEPSDFKEKFAPPILLGTGAALILLDAFVFLYKEPEYLVANFGTDEPAAAAIVRLVGAGINFLVALPFMVVGLVIAAKIFGSAFGGMLMSVYKLAAVLLLSIAVDLAFGSFMDRITEGEGDFIGYLSIAVNFAAFWAACGFVFDEIEFGEVATLYVVAFILPWILLTFVLLTVISSFM